ncbi:21686_t:CDS:2 [Gigaspora margarita]|uniref:21686_t:CDS:1 n=1 Tax=Gigaspora margarita TaxID=4874 RepID=A0ABN7WM62_GIGMA|nr:21686_t:CDS:2 [Gigaspora margarita]
MSHQRFQKIIKYLKLTDLLESDDSFYFARQFHNAFNENLTMAVSPGTYLCIDKSMCQWMGKVDKDALEDAYGSFVSQARTINNVNLTVCSIRDRKNIVLLTNCSMTILGSEVKRYIKDHGNVTFHRPVLFDEYCEYRSAIDILNNLRDNTLSYHDIISSSITDRAKKRRKQALDDIEHHFTTLSNGSRTS